MFMYDLHMFLYGRNFLSIHMHEGGKYQRQNYGNVREQFHLKSVFAFIRLYDATNGKYYHANVNKMQWNRKNRYHG